MKYFHALPTPSLLASASFRWHSLFRSHAGFTLLGILAIFIIVFLILQLAKGKDEPRNAGNNGTQK
jgi:hypothetical protein